MKTSIPCQRLFHCFHPTPSNKHHLLAKVAPLLNRQQSSSQPRLQPRCQRRAFEREEGQRGPLEKTAPARGPTGDCEITSIELPPAESPQRTASSKTPFALPRPLRRPPETTTTGDNMRSYEENTNQCFPNSKRIFYNPKTCDTYKHSWPVGTTARTLSTRKTFHNGRVARNLPKGSQGARGPNLNCQKISGNTRTVGVDAIRRPTVLRMHLTCTSSQCR